MDQKTKIVLREISYWKKNKILPQHYCDFLTALYTEGSENYLEPSSSPSKWKNNLPYILFTITSLLAVAIIAFLGYYFNDFSIQMQIALFSFLVFVAGVILKWFYVQFFGLFALMVIMGWGSLPFLEQHFSWMLFEGSWLGAALVFLFVAWITRTWNMKLSLNLYIHGILVIFVPLIQGMFLSAVPTDILQLILFSKIIFVSLFLFLSRQILDVYVKIFS